MTTPKRLTTCYGIGWLLALAGWSCAVGAASPAYDRLVAAAKKEGQVNVSTADTNEVLQAWTQAFQQEFGVKVVFQRLTQGPLQQRVEREAKAGRVQIDVIGFTLDPGWTETMAKSGHLAKLDPAELPTVAKMPTQFRGEYYVTTRVNPLAFLYNTKAVKESDIPTNLVDIMKKPEWRGRIATTNPRIGGTYYQWHFVMFKELGRQRYEEFVRALVQDMRAVVVESVVTAQNQVASGELLGVLPAPSSLAQEVIKSGAPVKLAYPKPVVGIQGSMLALSKGPHPNAGKLFLDWAIREKALTILCGTGGCAAPNTSIKGAVVMPKDTVYLNGPESYELGESYLSPNFQRVLGAR